MLPNSPTVQRKNREITVIVVRTYPAVDMRCVAAFAARMSPGDPFNNCILPSAGAINCAFVIGKTLCRQPRVLPTAMVQALDAGRWVHCRTEGNPQLPDSAERT
jgi:hypothetical protein